MPFPFALWKGRSFDPATLSLTAWWRASYSASPWVGTASAGASGSRDLTEATTPPAAGTALNSLTPADFDGVNDQLSSGGILSDFISASAWSVWCLFNADTATADSGAGSRYANPQFVCDKTDGYWNFGFSDAGVHIVNNAVEEVVVTCATGGWHLAQAKYNGSTVKLRVDSGARSSVAGTDIPFLTHALRVGARYNGATAFFDGRIAEIGIINSALSDATEDNVKSYINARYALSL